MGATSMDFLVADNDIFGLGEDTMSVFATLDITGTTDATNATGDTGILRCEGGASIAKKLFVGTDLDVDGTTNLDAVDIDGAVQIDAAVSVGVDDLSLIHI